MNLGETPQLLQHSPTEDINASAHLLNETRSKTVDSSVGKSTDDQMEQSSLNLEQVSSTFSSVTPHTAETFGTKEKESEVCSVEDDEKKKRLSPTTLKSPQSIATGKDDICSAVSSTPVPPLRTKKKKVTDFRCSEVRWFYRRNDVEKWINFNGRDSLRLETKYRAAFGLALDDYMTVELLNHGFTVGQSVVVMDGLYKVNDDLSKVEAIYWKGDSCEIRRGTWFSQDWQPLEPQVADVIEAHHLQCFRGQTIPEGLTVFSSKEGSNKPQLTELQLDGMEIRWSSVIDVSLSFKRGPILRYIGWGKSQALRRGFHKEAEWADGPPEISHLILVVHGIGQKGYENLIAENAQH
ncbi:hypothetical protein DICVIV_01751 [Dictyocaulus viviparus]|uniref:C20G8.02-like WWE domain-containing protein n=1 Tax=Dictyocaulus viviparus TaxID=29172 RepID=A0A0D8Y5N3_DICVI|nr:hypothetical protein DICVIV_01751 [Dictyocaulus viviparus]